MKCNNCGKDISDYSKFCEYCGSKTDMPKEYQNEILNNQKLSKNKKKILISVYTSGKKN